MTRLLTPGFGAIKRWTQNPTRIVDALFACLVAVLAVVEATGSEPELGERGPDLFAYITIVLGSAALLWRRRAPITVLVAVTTVVSVFYLRDGADFVSILGLTPFYAVTAHSKNRRQAWIAVAVAWIALMAVASVSILNTADGYASLSAVSMGSFIVIVSVAGGIMRNRERIFVDTQKRADAAEADRLAEAHRAVARERSRIAREMHDVVAHGMSVIAVQAAAAQEIVHTDPDKAAEVLGRIENVGRESLTEMRRMLGVLRNTDDDTEASLSPQPSLADIAGAVAQSIEAGVATELIITGEERDLPRGIELAAFRIVQEALTNVRKHAGRSASATVQIVYDDDAVTVEIDDDGRGAVSSLSDSGGGNGLMGMRERVEAYDGTFRAGPRSGGGYSIRAMLPVADATNRPSVVSTTATSATTTGPETPK